MTVGGGLISSFDNPLDFHTTFVSVKSASIVKCLKLAEILEFLWSFFAKVTTTNKKL